MNATPDTKATARKGRRIRRCIVHIGLNKTGSTTIQGWLAANRDALAEQGIRYDPFEGQPQPSMAHAIGFTSLAVHHEGRIVPSADARAHLKIDTLDDQARLVEDFEARAEDSITNGNYGTYVISSEFLPAWLPRPEMAKLFHDWLEQRFDRVRYVVYIRDQIDWVPSAYAQMIKMGGTESLEDYLERRGERNYFRSLRKWIDGVGRGKLDVRLLERDFLIDGDLVTDFAHVIGADMANTHAPKILNEAMDADALVKMLEVNRKAEKFPNLMTRAMRGQQVTKLLAASTGAKLRLTPEQALDVAQRNAESNERLRRRFFPDREVLFPKSQALLERAAAAEDRS